METMNEQLIHEPTKIEKERMDAMREALSKIDSLVKDSGLSELESANKLLNESRGWDSYRLEQAYAKLVELFEIKEDFKRREAEIMRWAPDAKSLLNTEAMNDANFNNPDKKYLVS